MAKVKREPSTGWPVNFLSSPIPKEKTKQNVERANESSCQPVQVQWHSRMALGVT